MSELPKEGQLAMRILNFVIPYIPDHIREESLEIIRRETSKPASIKDDTKHNYAHTRIRWKDSTCNDGDEYDVIFKLNSKRDFLGTFEVDPKDDQIFFYCESEEEFKRIAKGYDNGEEFEVIGCIYYTETI
jgi:hypothetical protein